MASETRNTSAGYLATFADFIIVALAVASILVGSLATLVAWLVASVLYLCLGVYLVRYLSRRDISDSRVGTLQTLSWVIPLVSSLAGANAALIALVGGTPGFDAGVGKGALAALGVLGIVVSWLLLHIGFANIYAARFGGLEDSARPGSVAPLRFPEEGDPGIIEFVYFSLTIGATFATSDVEVTTRPMRVLVAVHCVVSFFFNALVVAAAFQLLQQLAG